MQAKDVRLMVNGEDMSAMLGWSLDDVVKDEVEHIACSNSNEVNFSGTFALSARACLLLKYRGIQADLIDRGIPVSCRAIRQAFERGCLVP